MNSDKMKFIECYFEDLELSKNRAIELCNSKKYHLEGITMLICHIAAIARTRFPQLKDWLSFKRVVNEYSGLSTIFDNIDLLFFYQWPTSKLSNDNYYSKLENYQQILDVFKKEYGDEEGITTNSTRYKSRHDLLILLLSKNLQNFDRDNFEKYIELFSNNQIFYQYARCEAIHNNDFPLINIGYTFPDMQRTYTDNHQITREVIKNCLSGIINNLKKECIAKCKLPEELTNDGTDKLTASKRQFLDENIN